MTVEASTIPGYLAGTWTIDAVHSDVSFSVRHMMISKVKGRFGSFSGSIVTADNPLGSSVTAEIDLNSIDTNNSQRDDHIRSGDFFEVEKHPKMTFTSTSVEADGGDFVVHGDLSLKGHTKNVPLKLELNGFGPDAYGGTRAGFTATTEISRKEFGVDIDMPMDGGGVVIGDKISIALEIEAVLQQG
ncbi:MAG: YceI family protein [Actinomycetota bacterium]|nr:YceI family protein [Actinomycetota bacterium]MDQ2956622.1 YceI family protein [Actinomycetota bacterium]